ncbi:MAG TPA: aminotransferase class V-fold PLP-dependent enzyme [Bacteroidales bacterium]|nr:aminotransferase class V-fold PLP-dependent enzyme [Bacteroidales bacterium]HRZ20023.1 aminotransferase class V-fold PLP-dependent enzyme [Bacteroidales bacterium]
MSINRRLFVKQLAATMSAATLLPGTSFGEEWFNEAILGFPPENTPDDDFWAWMQQAYTTSPNIINLNNGGVSPQPKVVQDTFERYNRLCNEAPSYYMWRILDQGREALRADLAAFAGCGPEEISINRNTTEAMNNIIYGLNLQPGDEVVLARQDYPNVINTFRVLEKRDGIVLKWVNLELPSEDEEELANAYIREFTGKTKLVNVTHIINWIGQIIPVKKIAQAAHQRGIEVLVDGAHTFALLDFRIPDLECDYFATSLHKWMCAPFGSGLLYVNKEKIPKIWPICPDDNPLSDQIVKFERLGTRSFATEMAIGSALDFHLAIGTRRKEERLRFLKDYWTTRVKDIPGVRIHTSFKSEFACVIGLFSIEGYKPEDIDAFLFYKHKIHTTGIIWENIAGVRVTPHVYTTLRDLDKLVVAIEELALKKP